IGFAIPSNQAKTVVAALKSNGSVERGWLGVQIQNLDDELAASLGLDHDKGALVGDVITKFNDHDVDSARTLSRVVADANPNDTARVTVWRNGKSHELKIKLGEASKAEQVASASPASD